MLVGAGTSSTKNEEGYLTYMRPEGKSGEPQASFCLIKTLACNNHYEPWHLKPHCLICCPACCSAPMQSCEQPGATGGHGVGWSEIPRYAFDLPEGWSETPVSIADLGGTEVSSVASTVLSSQVMGTGPHIILWALMCTECEGR